MQNFVAIGLAHFKPEHCEFLSNFEFDQNTVSGMGNQVPELQMSCSQIW